MITDYIDTKERTIARLQMEIIRVKDLLRQEPDPSTRSFYEGKIAGLELALGVLDTY